MKIKKLQLTNFKRFTNLTIDNIPDETKLVLLIGSNGSGKSSVFDAFDWIRKGAIFKGLPNGMDYYAKISSIDPEIIIQLSGSKAIIQKKGENPLETEQKKISEHFIGRSSIRIVPRITNNADTNQVFGDFDSPKTYIENDTRFINDVFLFIDEINNALQQPVFQGKQADTLKIFRDYIDPLNQSLLTIFGGDETTTIQIIEFINASHNNTANLIFQKGKSRIGYELLSHGEKQVVILLINFIVRKEYYKNAIIFIDEMDCHLNTALQYQLLDEIVTRWIPENSQLWTASHALGFIEYARNADKAVIFDFDNFDFDIPKILYPESKDNPDVYNVAVGKEFLPSLFQNLDIYFIEGKDKDYYASVGIQNTVFVSDNNRNTVYHKVRVTGQKGIVDRDFLSDGDIFEIRHYYPKIRVLNYYSIENYMYHPDNLQSYHEIHTLPFDKDQYIKDLTETKNKIKDAIIPSLGLKRTEYPYFGEPMYNGSVLQKRFKNNQENMDEAAIVAGYLNSNDLETYYKVLPMKTYCTDLPQRQNISKIDLVQTSWFKESISTLLQLV